MALTRRQTLSILGGGAIVAAAGATVTRVTRMPETATAPWAAAGSYGDLRRDALSHATLAPNPHNRQPWIVDLSQPNEATLFVDTDRLLPHTDPFNRQIVIGLGCFLEVARMAAAEEGLGMAADLFPAGFDNASLDARPVAVMRFGGTESPDPLFPHVLERRSHKEPFDTSRPVDRATLDAVLAAARGTATGGSVAEADVESWRSFTREALRIEIETPRTYKESVDLFRIGSREVDANPDGIDFTGPTFEALATSGLFSRDSALDRSSMAYEQGLAAVYANTDTAMGHLWQVTPTNTRLDQIEAGRDWVRLNLAATALGLGMQPLSQALQEYPEMDALYREGHDRLAPEGGTVQMLARIGYGEAVPASPRWPLEAKIVNG